MFSTAIFSLKDQLEIIFLKILFNLNKKNDRDQFMINSHSHRDSMLFLLEIQRKKTSNCMYFLNYFISKNDNATRLSDLKRSKLNINF